MNFFTKRKTATVTPASQPHDEDVATPAAVEQHEESAPAVAAVAAVPETRPVFVDPVPKPLDRTEEPREVLSRCMSNYFVGVPQQAIIDTWAAYGTPSAVGTAFFLYPHDEATVFFERDVMPLSLFADENAAKTRRFIGDCRARVIQTVVAHALDTTDPLTVVAQVMAGFEGHMEGQTALLELLQAG